MECARLQSQPSAFQRAETPTYPFVNQKVVSHYTEEIVRAVYMRSVGGIQNVFAIESVMDMLADKAGVDPVEFRLRYLKDERMKSVLRATADLANWSTVKNAISCCGGFDCGRKGGAGVERCDESGEYQAQ